MKTSVTLTLPDWLDEELLSTAPQDAADMQQRMSFVISLAERNVSEGSGGPFAAAIFEAASGKIVACGVNIVVPACCAVAHAEIVAIMLACRRLNVHNLSLGPASGYELMSSTDPCAMCLGAIPWSGVCRLVCGADADDAVQAGFDEGAKPADWINQLSVRGIKTVRHVCRTEAAAVIKRYAANGGIIYNGG